MEELAFNKRHFFHSRKKKIENLEQIQEVGGNGQKIKLYSSCHICFVHKMWVEGSQK